MFQIRPRVREFRRFVTLGSLALITACGPGSVPPIADVPASVVATAGNATVTLTWAASSGATSYAVQRAETNGGPYAQIASPTSTTYIDKSVTNGTTYYYVVAAVNVAGQSGNSAQASATPEVPTVPPVPTDVVGVSGNQEAVLTWSASSGATSYNVKRAATSGGPYTTIASPTSTSYTDSPLINGTAYYYVVSAVNAIGESANSAQVLVVPSPPPPTTFGTWTNVTPTNVDLTGSVSCDANYGASTVQQDPANPSNLYAQFDCQGIWKSTDYGVTWTGPINTGTNGTTVANCSGGISISPASTAAVPTLFEACIRGNAIGVWQSVDGGIDWTNIVVTPTTRQDYYPPVFDPYDPTHLLMAGHEFDSIVESTDGGQNWSSVSLEPGMLQNGGTGFIFFLNTGSASTTRGNWLWIAQQSGGAYGTWRTMDGGTTWNRVDNNEHPLGAAEIYQPDNSGVVFMAGANSALGNGVLRSSDYGETWTHVGMTNDETVVFGTSNDVYSMFGAPVGPGGSSNPNFEVASQPGTGTWVAPGTPAALTQGAAQIIVVHDGTSNIFVGAMWDSGLWRYVEP